MDDFFFDGSVLVVIPVKNEERYIGKCLAALVRQDYNGGKISVIVVDNGSTDETVNIVRQFDNIDLLSKVTGTIGALRNFGSNFSKSNFVAFLDGDSVPPNNWLSTGVSILNERASAGVGFSIDVPYPEDSWVRHAWHKLGSTSKYAGTCDVRWLSSFNLIFKRDVFEKVKGFDESLVTCEDVDIGLRMSRLGNLIYSDKIKIRHLGEVNSLKEFFFKELWRGRSNWQHFIISPDKKSDVLSVVVPLCYIVSVVLAPAFVLLNRFLAAFFVIVLLVLPVLFILSKGKKHKLMPLFFQKYILSSVYLLARGLSLFGR